MKSLIKDRNGNVIGMVVMIMLCFLFAILWIATMPAVGMVWNIVGPNLPVEASGTMDMLNNACGWTLLIFIIGTIIYGAAWATHRNVVEYPA